MTYANFNVHVINMPHAKYVGIPLTDLDFKSKIFIDCKSVCQQAWVIYAPRSMSCSTLNLHVTNMIQSKYYNIWSIFIWKQEF